MIKTKQSSIEILTLTECLLIPFLLQHVAVDEEDEPVAESGRLFLRNLAYTCTEEEIKTLFEKYGPVAEVHLPIDKATKRITGIGFVTFVMPEHAVTAFNELDGRVFQGRLLHLMPAKAKKTSEDASINEGSSLSNNVHALLYKKQALCLDCSQYFINSNLKHFLNGS